MLYVHYPGTTETEIKKIEEMRETKILIYVLLIIKIKILPFKYLEKVLDKA